MARIAGVDLPRDKRVEISLTYIYGIGRTISQEILETAGVDPNTRVRDLAETEVARLREVIDSGDEVDMVIAIGPTIMMKFVVQLTKEYDLPTLVSLNPIMIDGTGMCGGCRVQVDGEAKFTCVDGPEFDGHAVDFDDLMKRQRVYLTQEQESLHKYTEECKLAA